MQAETYRRCVQAHLVHRHLIHTLKGVNLYKCIMQNQPSWPMQRRNKHTSPPSGQFGAEDQNAGHTEH